MTIIDRRSALRTSLLYTLAGSAVADGETGAGGTAGLAPDAWLSVTDPRFGGGAKGDGRTDDTAAIAAAAAAAAALGRPLFMVGRYAVAGLQLPGGSGLHIIGNPVFVQARPDTPCIRIRERPLQQALGCWLRCTVIPHPQSSRSNPRNVAIDLTGFSSSDITVQLGAAERHSDMTGRFHTIVYADAASPFHYGNRIRLVANAVPSPRYGLRYRNRGRGAAANPNVNSVSGWFNALDTGLGDVLIDLGDTTQAIVEGPSLMEACPGAVGIRAGNFTTIRDVWFEAIGIAIDFTPTADTVPNDCRVDRCQFSGPGHIVRITRDLGAPPTFNDCLGDEAVRIVDQDGAPRVRALRTGSRLQPPAPGIAFMQGGGRIVPDRNSLRHPIDHHGRTTHHLRFLVDAAAPGAATMRLSPPADFAIEQVAIGVRGPDGRLLAWGLGDDADGRDYDWAWLVPGIHALNIRVTMTAAPQS